MLDAWLRCMGAALLAWLALVGLGVAVFLAVVLVGGVVCGVIGVVTGGAGFAECMVGLLGFLATLLAALGIGLGALLVMVLVIGSVYCALQTLGLVAAVGGGGPTAVGGALQGGTPIDCASAQQLLAAAQAALAVAEAQRDAAQARADQTRDRLNRALAAEAGAIAGVIASVWQPWLLPAAIAAVAAATALVVRRTRQYGEALGTLAAAETAVLRALVDVAAAEALVLTLCAAGASGTPDLSNGVLVGGNVPATQAMAGSPTIP